MMKITILGTGTSQGVPVIGCTCEVCQSDDPRDRRLRCSVAIEWGGKQIVIDVGPDFRQQMLANQLSKIDAILLTHEHNDHIIGLDDVRPFNFLHQMHLPVYGMKRVLKDVRERFAYVFDADPYPGAPRINLHPIAVPHRFQILELPSIIPIEVWHGKLPILGYRLGDFSYLTDVKTLPPASLEKVKNTKILVLSALHHRSHHSHLNLEEAIALAQEINAEQTYFIHFSHRMGKHAEVSLQLPDNIFLAYDGLELILED